MHRLLAGIIFLIASAAAANACSVRSGPVPEGLAAAHTVAKLRLISAEEARPGIFYEINAPSVLMTFETLETYSGEDQSEWQVVWRDGSESRIAGLATFNRQTTTIDALAFTSSEGFTFGFSETSFDPPFAIGETYIAGIVRPETQAYRHCALDQTFLPCIPDGTGGYFPELMSSPCSGTYAFAHSAALEAQVVGLLESPQ